MAFDDLSTAPDFQSFIAERTENFVGRGWVFDRVDAWLASGSGPRTFLLAGPPGSGKSAIAARLVQLSEGQVAGSWPCLRSGFLVHDHFCQAGLDSTLSPTTFVQSLSEALANRYRAFQEALQAASPRHVTITVNQRADQIAGGQMIGVQLRLQLTGGDARTLFDEAVRQPLVKLCGQQPNERIVLLIDSLDEALSFHVSNNIVQLLRLTNDFPSQVLLVLTCRSKSERVFDLVGRPTLDLVDDAPPGLDEVKQYALVRLHDSPKPVQGEIAEAIAAKSKGNFLYAFHVLNDLLRAGSIAEGIPKNELPDELEDVYRKFLERELDYSARWNGVYRPLLGAIAVAHGEGLTREQLIGITDLEEDTANDVLGVCEQYLVGSETDGRPWRIYHQSFRDFLLNDRKYNVFPAERHAAVGRYFQDLYASNWGTCSDEYALRYAPLHWSEAAAGAVTESKRAARTQQLIALTSQVPYQRQFERCIGELLQLQQLLLRATEVAAMNAKAAMLLWVVRSAKACVRFRRDFLDAEPVLALAEKGGLDGAQKRLAMFVDVSQDWQTAGRLILAWLAFEKAPDAARALYEGVSHALSAPEPLALLSERVRLALEQQPEFPCPPPAPVDLADARERVKRISGQAFNRELLTAVNPSLMMIHGEMLSDQKGYASAVDGVMLVHAARVAGQEEEGAALFDEYVSAHGGYNYVEYRNQSLWLILSAALGNHPSQDWVKRRLRLILSVALSGGGADFEEMLPLAAATMGAPHHGADAGSILPVWGASAGDAAGALGQQSANDSWGTHKRRFIAMMELQRLIAGDEAAARQWFQSIGDLPGGFAGFQAPASLRLADGLRASRLDTPALLDQTLLESVKLAHRIQDYHFCARVTARCNTLARWHRSVLKGADLADAVKRLAASASDVEFAADHKVGEPFAYRDEGDPQTLSVDPARQANTLEQLVDVFQRPALEFLRVNPGCNLSATLAPDTIVRVPDPGLPPLLAIHLSARVLADDSLEAERMGLIRSLVPLTVTNATALDTVLSYLLVAATTDDADLLGEIEKEVGPPELQIVAAPVAQVGPDVIPV